MIPAAQVLYPAGGGQVGKTTPGRGRAIDGLERSGPRVWRRDKVREAFLRAKE